MPTQHYVIIGASLAGAHASTALREQGFTGKITLVGAERHLPYQRPGLSKGYLSGAQSADELFVHPEAKYAEQQIELLLGRRAVELDTATQRVVLDDGQDLAYDRLLLATGSTPTRLSIPGSDLDGIHTLRTINDSGDLKAAITKDSRVAVVGAGWIGSEVAATARQIGADVTLLDPLDQPLQAALGTQVGSIFATDHRNHGVLFRGGAHATAFEGEQGRITAVRINENDLLEADLVVMGVGATPVTGLAERAGIAVDNGIVVDEFLRTSAPRVYAAGDVANVHNTRYQRAMRVEHWDNALRQGQAVAAAMTDQAVAYDRIPYFFSTQYDTTIEYTGHATGDVDQVVLRGNPATGTYMAFWLNGNRIEAGLNANSWGAADTIRHLIETEAPVDIEALADESNELDSHALVH